MNQPFSADGLKTLFRYPLQGKEWGRKMLYLGLFWMAGLFIPVFPWLFAMGYFAEITRRFAEGDSSPDLPEWTDWNRILTDGLRIFGVVLIVGLPIAAIFIMGMANYFGATFATVGLGESGYDWLGFVTMMGGMMVLFFTIALSMLASVAAGIGLAPAVTHMLVQDRFAAFFRGGEWWRVLRATLGGYLIALFIILGLGFAYQLLTQIVASTIILCGALPVLWAVACPYLTVVSAVVLGSAYHEGKQKLLEGTADEPAAVGD